MKRVILPFSNKNYRFCSVIRSSSISLSKNMRQEIFDNNKFLGSFIRFKYTTTITNDEENNSVSKSLNDTELISNDDVIPIDDEMSESNNGVSHFTENTNMGILDRDHPYSKNFRREMIEDLKDLIIEYPKLHGILMNSRDIRKLKLRSLLPGLPEKEIVRIKLELSESLSDFESPENFFEFVDKQKYILNCDDIGLDSSNQLYLNNEFQTKKFLSTLNDNHVISNLNEKFLVSLSQVFGQGKTAFVRRMKNKTRMSKYDFSEYNYDDDYVIKFSTFLAQEKTFESLEDAKKYVKRKIHEMMFKLLFSEIGENNRKKFFNHYYENDSFTNISEKVQVPSNKHIVFCIDEIGRLVKEVRITNETISSFEASVILSYFIWIELAYYQSIEHATVVVIGRGTPFAYFGTGDGGSPTRNDHFHLSLLNEEDIKKLLIDFIVNRKKLSHPNNDDLKAWSEEIKKKSCGIPRAVFECFRSYPNFKNIKKLKSLNSNKRDGHLLLYNAIDSQEKFHRNSEMTLDEINEILHSKSFLNEPSFGNVKVPIFSLLDNLGIPYHFDDTYIYPVIPESFLGNQEVNKVLKNMVKFFSPDQFQEFLSGNLLLSLPIIQFDSLKFLKSSKFYPLPNIPRKRKVKELSISKNWTDEDYNSFFSHISPDYSTVFKFGQTSSSADEILGVSIINDEKKTKEDFLVCVQDKNYHTSQLQASAVLDELNKFAKLITYDQTKNTKVLGLIVNPKEKIYKVKFLKKNYVTLDNGEKKQIGYQFDHDEFKKYIKENDPTKANRWEDLMNIPSENFDAYVLSGEEDLKYFYGDEMAEFISKNKNNSKQISQMLEICLKRGIIINLPKNTA